MTSFEALTRWVLVLFLLKLVTARPTRRLLGESLEALSLPLVLLIWSCLYWFVGSVYQVDRLGVVLWMSGALSVAGLCWLSKKPDLASTEKIGLKAFETTLVFFALLGIGITIRSYSPSLSHAEKFADLAFLQSVLLDNQFPPMDRWLSGESVNYYYFGYLLFAPLIRLSGVPVELAFGLSACTVFALMGSTAYGVVRYATRDRLAAGVALLAMTVLSNWEWMVQAFKRGSLSPFSWWTSSRAMPGTITEFPFFSFLLGDLHPHFVALPWLTLTVGLLWAFRKALAENSGKHTWVLGGLTALAVGVHYPLNPWELPFVAMLVALVMARKWKVTLSIGVLALVLFLPFWLTYEKPVSSPHWVPANLRSDLLLFLSHWGLFLLPLGGWLGFRAWKDSRKRQGIIVGLSLLLGWMVGPVFGLLVGLGVWVGIFCLRQDKDDWAWVVILSLGFIALCEVIHLDDLYGPDMKRMNTVFKFYTLAWWGLSLSLPIMMFRAWKIKKRGRLGFALVLVGLVSCSLVYPVTAVWVRSERTVEIPTLDGMAYWQRALPGEREAVNWLREHAGPQDVIWEAFGPPYREYARFASLTGRPSVLGWANHEWVWRKDGHQLTQEREAAIQEVMKHQSVSAVAEFARKYSVRWVIVGKLETKIYPPGLLDALSVFPLAFSNQTIQIRGIKQP